MSISPEDLGIAKVAGVSLEAVRIVRAYAPAAFIERLLGYDDDYNDIEVAGITFALEGADPDAHMRVVLDLDDSLSSMGYAAFLTERNRLSETERDTLHEYLAAIIRSEDPLEPVRLRNTAAFNYELSNADIVEKLEAWNKQFGVRVIGADYDWVALTFKTLPKDLKIFAADIYVFCPDAIEQGTAPVYESMDDDQLREAGYLLEAGMDPEEGGLALLAQQIAKTKSLHLWWD